MFFIIICIILFFVFVGSSSSSSGSSNTTSSSHSRNNDFRQNSTNSTHSHTSTNRSVTTHSNTVSQKKCECCKSINNSSAITCKSCGWKLSTPYIHQTLKLTGVTYNNRQQTISRLREFDTIQLKRDKYNVHDKNAIEVCNSSHQSIGWIPKEHAARIAPVMDKGNEFYISLASILGGNGYNYGVEITITNDSSKAKKTKTPPAESKIRQYVTNQSNKGQYTKIS